VQEEGRKKKGEGGRAPLRDAYLSLPIPFLFLSVAKGGRRRKRRAPLDPFHHYLLERGKKGEGEPRESTPVETILRP